MVSGEVERVGVRGFILEGFSYKYLYPQPNFYKWVDLMARRGLFRWKIAGYVARIASGIVDPGEFDSGVLARHVVEAIRSVGMQLRDERNGVLVCPLCGKGPFTRRGYFLHLTRLHYSHLIDLVEVEADRIAGVARNVVS